MEENSSNSMSGDMLGNETLKDITNVIKKANSNLGGMEEDGTGLGSYVSGSSASESSVSGFKVASTNLPAKPSFWTKVKNALFYEIKVELTPYQQKIENEINEFLHQPITWKSLKEAALSEVPITFRGKRIF